MKYSERNNSDTEQTPGGWGESVTAKSFGMRPNLKRLCHCVLAFCCLLQHSHTHRHTHKRDIYFSWGTLINNPDSAPFMFAWGFPIWDYRWIQKGHAFWVKCNGWNQKRHFTEADAVGCAAQNWSPPSHTHTQTHTLYFYLCKDIHRHNLWPNPLPQSSQLTPWP